MENPTDNILKEYDMNRGTPDLQEFLKYTSEHSNEAGHGGQLIIRNILRSELELEEGADGIGLVKIDGMGIDVYVPENSSLGERIDINIVAYDLENKTAEAGIIVPQ